MFLWLLLLMLFRVHICVLCFEFDRNLLSIFLYYILYYCQIRIVSNKLILYTVAYVCARARPMETLFVENFLFCLKSWIFVFPLKISFANEVDAGNYESKMLASIRSICEVVLYRRWLLLILVTFLRIAFKWLNRCNAFLSHAKQSIRIFCGSSSRFLFVAIVGVIQ